MAELEKKLQQKVLQFCKQNSILAVKVESQSTRGWPDLTVIVQSVVLFVELKTETGRQSPLQKHVEKQIKEKGGNYHVIRTIDQFRALIDAHTTGGGNGAL